MPACVLRISGPHRALAKALAGAFVPFAESGKTQRDRRLGRITEDDDSTFNFTISNADGNHVPVQIEEAEAFLLRHAVELEELLSREGVDGGMIDFGWDLPISSAGQWNRFPPSLLAICAKLDLAIEVSVYLDSRTK